MSVGKKLEGMTAGLGAMLESRKAQTPSANRAAPAQLLTFREEMNKYEDRIAILERELAEARSTGAPVAAYEARIAALEAERVSLTSKLALATEGEISVAQIEPNPWQPRIDFSADAIQELAASISETGLIQPILVRSVPTRDTFQLIAGERRWRAHQLLGLEKIKAVVLSVTDSDAAVMALAENIEREDLADFEIACAIRKVEKDFPNRKRLAEAIGIGRQDLYKFLAFEKLPASIKADLKIKPNLLGRNAAEQVAGVLKASGLAAVAQLEALWPMVVAGRLDQMKLAAAIQRKIEHGEVKESKSATTVELEHNGVVYGEFTRNKSGATIKLRDSQLTTEKETQLLKFIQGLMAE